MRVLRNKLKEVRTEHKLTQQELADQIGVCRDNICRLEGNKFKNPTYEQLYTIAVYFKRPVESIFWYVDV